MPLPDLSEYSQAIQNPATCFADSELSKGQIEVYKRGGRTGLPVLDSGSFAGVYQVTNGAARFAVRCFIREVSGQKRRYEELGRYMSTMYLPNFVGFQYLEQGIKVQNAWYPVLKMEWAEGLTLDRFIKQHWQDAQRLRFLAAQWRGLVASLRGAGIAHGDLQHGNVLVDDTGFMRLVDYDGMFIPSFKGENSPELGHSNYQHPARTDKFYNDTLDNFSALVVYTSLLAIAAEPALWTEFGDDDNFVFKRADYEVPSRSRAFQRVRKSSDQATVALASYLEQCCHRSVDGTPDLETVISNLKVRIPSGAPPARESQPARTAVTASLGLATPTTLPTQGLVCPSCGHANKSGMIYCINPDCFAVLDPNRKVCPLCKSSIPDNVLFCPECGQTQ